MAINKLSDIKPLKALSLNEADLNNYVFKSKRVEIDIEKNYDIALVLGCGIYDIMQFRADDAVRLYKQGVVNKLFLTGGFGFLSKNRDTSEASIMRNYMLAQGISDKDIIIEDKSRDTYENMKNSLRQIEDECGKDGKIVIVTSDFHSKRSKGMLEKMTSCDVYSYGVLDGKHDLETWNHYNFSTKKLIRTEALLLSWYTKRGIINDQEINPINKKLR